MTNMLCESAFFGVVISLLAYELGMLLKKKFGLPIFNPLLISIAVVIVFLAVFDIDYQNYNDGAKYLSYLLTPATVCLAIPLYEQMEALKKNIKDILGHQYRIGLLCDRYGEGHGDGRCRGRDEQPFDCSCRYSDCGRSVDLCDVYLKTNTDKKQKKSGNGKQCKTFRSRIFYP